jgi:hypothetical protein
MGTLLLTGAGKGTVGGGAGATSATWNPSDKAANVTLSNFNLTMVGTTGPESVRTGATLTTNQNVYIETILDNRAFNPRIGFASSVESLTVALGTSFPPESFGLGYNTGIYNCGGSADDGTATLPGGMANGDEVDLAFNSVLLRVWFRLQGGGWNITIGGAQDPAAGTGGLIVSANNALTTYSAIAEASANADQITARFSSASWVRSAPSGYTQLAT